MTKQASFSELEYATKKKITRRERCLSTPDKRYNTPMPHDSDASYKLLFSAPEVVRDLVLGFIPDD